MKTSADLIKTLEEALKKGLLDDTGKALDEAFAFASVPAGKLKSPTSLGMKLFLRDKTILNDLHGSYKQALCGNNPKTKTEGGMLAREKCNDWNAMKDRTIREAQLEYICLVIEIAKIYKDDRALTSFCKDTLSKPEKFNPLYRDVLAQMSARRSSLGSAEQSHSNTVSVLTEKTQKRLIAYGISLAEGVKSLSAKSAHLPAASAAAACAAVFSPDPGLVPAPSPAPTPATPGRALAPSAGPGPGSMAEYMKQKHDVTEHNLLARLQAIQHESNIHYSPGSQIRDGSLAASVRESNSEDYLRLHAFEASIGERALANDTGASRSILSPENTETPLAVSAAREAIRVQQVTAGA